MLLLPTEISSNLSPAALVLLKGKAGSESEKEKLWSNIPIVCMHPLPGRLRRAGLFQKREKRTRRVLRLIVVFPLF